jgi:hypothetical protein
MRLQSYTLLICFLLFNGACRVKEDLCAAYLCDAPMAHIQLKFISASSNQDLLFGPSATYKPSNLSIKSSLFAENIPFSIDSTDKNNKLIMVSVSVSQTLTFQLADLPQDVLTIDTKYRNAGCCGELHISRLQLNQTTLCSNCGGEYTIVLSK